MLLYDCWFLTAVRMYTLIFAACQPGMLGCRDPGSNRGPSDLQSDALPTELSRRWRSTDSAPAYIVATVPEQMLISYVSLFMLVTARISTCIIARIPWPRIVDTRRGGTPPFTFNFITADSMKGGGELTFRPLHRKQTCQRVCIHNAL